MFKQKICFEIWGGENGKYRLMDNKGNVIDTAPEDTCSRVANALAGVEAKNKEKWADSFKDILGTKFAGGGRIMANAGSKNYKKEVSLINCVVSSQLADSMDAIMDLAKEAALVLKAGCGIGYDFSPLRPKGARVYGAGAGTSGVISFMKIFDSVCSTILSGGGRRGSQLGALDIQHPDVEEFIVAKREDGVLRYFNVSVLITDRFMKAVQDNGTWDLWFWEKIRDASSNDIDEDKIKLIKKNDIPFRYPEYQYFRFAADHAETAHGNCSDKDVFMKKVYRTIEAADLFEKITKSTYAFNDPGFLLIDKVNYENNLWFTETIRTSNPCVTGDTRLHTNLGLVKIKDLYDNQCEIKCSVDGRTLDGKPGVFVRDALPVFKTGDKAEIFKITTKAGYEIRATEWHNFYTSRGKIKLKDLKIGDELFIQSGEGQFGNQGSYELGFVYGMLVGDGSFSRDGEHYTADIGLWAQDRDLATKLEAYFNNNTKDVETLNTNGREYESHFISITGRDELRISSRLMARKLASLGCNMSDKYVIPEFIWQGTKECVIGFLHGLFQSDGHVDYNEEKRSCQVRLNSSEPRLLKQVQILLSNFGLLSRILLRREECDKLMPDGKGGSKEYHCKKNYELHLGASSRDLFMKYIGFVLPYKNDVFNSFRDSQKRRSKQDAFITTITDISYAGQEPVYDTTQNDKNSIIFNGLVTGNCGEQPLGPQANCLLGSMILVSYISDAFTNKASFDWDAFKKDVRTANRALDNVVEINNLPLKELDSNLRNQRRHGLGFTGLGSALNMLKMPYGSKDSVEFAEKVMLVMAQESLLENIDVAKEKGCAPVFEPSQSREDFINSGYMKRLLETFGEEKLAIVASIKKHGVRWSHATSIAPTGTLSLTWGNNCSNGIEPIFANSYLRNIRAAGKKTKVQEEVLDYAYFEWKQKNGDDDLPSYWRTTDNLTIEDHIKIQSAVQKWCDSSISKTINVPTNYAYEDFKNVYFTAWKSGLKGVTTYRFNPEVTSGVLVQRADLEKSEYVFVLEDGTEVNVHGSDTVMYDGEEHIAANLFDALKEGMYGNM